MMTLATSHTSAKAGSDLLMEEICRRVSGRVRPAEPAAVREVIALTHQVGITYGEMIIRMIRE